jgi:hypothetical protein
MLTQSYLFLVAYPKTYGVAFYNQFCPPSTLKKVRAPGRWARVVGLLPEP